MFSKFCGINNLYLFKTSFKTVFDHKNRLLYANNKGTNNTFLQAILRGLQKLIFEFVIFIFAHSAHLFFIFRKVRIFREFLYLIDNQRVTNYHKIINWLLSAYYRMQSPKDTYPKTIRIRILIP